MRFALRSTILLVALYAFAVSGLFLMVDRLLQDAVWEAMEETAGVIGKEVARALAEPLREATLGTDQQARTRLREQVTRYVQDSPIVSDAVVVDTYGQVVVSDVGRPELGYPTPSELFGEDRRPKLSHARGATLHSGAFLLQVPVHEGEESMGYIQLSLESADIARRFDAARRNLLAVAGAGLLVIGVLGFLLHLHLTGRERELVNVLEGALQGRAGGAPVDGDEERPVVQAAERLGDALRRERRLRDATSRSISHIGRLLDVGVALAGPDGRLEFAEPQARQLLELGDGPDKDWGHVVPHLRPAFDRAHDGRQGAVDVELPRPGGDKRLRVQVIPMEGGEAGFLVIVRDRAIIQAIQTDLRMAAQLRNLTRLYLGVAHDLKAPLNAMVLNVQLLKQSIGEPDPAADPPTPEQRQRRWIDVLERELKRLHRGLEMVLAQTAPSQRERQLFDLRRLVEDVVELLAPQARQQKVAVRHVLPADSVNVRALRDAISQSVVNLCINSFEAMPGGGELTLTVAQSGSEALVSIRDTGPGIAPEIEQRMFELHVTSKSSGTGIGLHVARNVIEGEGGTLVLTQTGPSGTCFELRLPCVTVPSAVVEGA